MDIHTFIPVVSQDSEGEAGLAGPVLEAGGEQLHGQVVILLVAVVQHLPCTMKIGRQTNKEIYKYT